MDGYLIGCIIVGRTSVRQLPEAHCRVETRPTTFATPPVGRTSVRQREKNLNCVSFYHDYAFHKTVGL